MDELIERLKQATGPDPELDYDIQCEMDGRGKPPAYTGSFDAALTLVPRGVWWRCSCDIDLTPTAVVGGSQYAEVGATPAIALCIAALKALLSDQR